MSDSLQSEIALIDSPSNPAKRETLDLISAELESAEDGDQNATV